MRWTTALLAAALLPLAAQAHKSTAEGIAEYRAMLADGNPAELFEARGEDLWKQPRGPKNASLQQCDLGQGPGVVKGAFVQLPRWFADTQRVQDLESRLLTCMERLQGLNAAAIAAERFGVGEQKNMESLVAWISAESRGMKFDLPTACPAASCGACSAASTIATGSSAFRTRVSARTRRSRCRSTWV